MPRIYAKSEDESGYKEPLYEHTKKDIIAGRRLIQNLPFGPVKKRCIGRLLDETIAFHDVGKSATGFQASLEEGAKYWGHRHEIVSAAAATSANANDLVIFGIITHHKKILSDGLDIHGCLPDEELPYQNHINTVWLEMAKQWNANIPSISEEFTKICQFIKRPDLLASPLSLSLLSNNIVNWLHRKAQVMQFGYKQREYASLLRGLTMSADHLMSAGDYIPPRIPDLKRFAVTSYELYGFQLAVSKAKGDIILRAPTGSGKTEAALLWAQLNQQYNGRMFYALPTTASINAMYLRLQKIFSGKDNLVGLLHSRTVSSLYSMFEANGNGKALDNQALARDIGSLVREMYFPIRVCTPHQVLRYTLQGKGWEAMLSEFPHSVFIFDEIHAYNPKLTGLTMATVRYLTKHKATCMFLTATLPTFIRSIIEQQLPDIKFIQPSYDNPSDKRILEQKRHTVEPIDGNILDNLENILSLSDKASSTLIVCNHVRTSQQVYQALKQKVSDTILLHSQFTRRDRNKIEASLSQRLPRILVATQVVEVSLDLDFEQMFTEPAPIDALVQRMGRVNRKAAQLHPAKVHIFTDQYSDANRPYTRTLRDASVKVLTGLPMPLSEEDLNAGS